MKDRVKGEGGFSLVELLVVIGIIAVMAAVVVPPLTNYLKLYRIRGAAQQVYSEITAARLEAIKRNVSFGVVYVTLSNTTYRYVIEDNAVPPNLTAPPSLAGQAVLAGQAGPVRTLPLGVQFGAGCTGFAGANAGAFRFRKMGDACVPSASSTSCPNGDIDMGTNLMQNLTTPAGTSPAGVTICLVQPQTALRKAVYVDLGGRVRNEE